MFDCRTGVQRSDFRKVPICREEAWVAPPEYVVVKKLAYFREGGSQKHLEDIQGMMDVSGDHIDIDIINRWLQKLGMTDYARFLK